MGPRKEAGLYRVMKMFCILIVWIITWMYKFSKPIKMHVKPSSIKLIKNFNEKKKLILKNRQKIWTDTHHRRYTDGK